LCDALKNNPNVLIRRASAKTLNIIGSKVALPNLIEAFRTDDDPVVQGSSAGAMATIGEPAIESLYWKYSRIAQLQRISSWSDQPCLELCRIKSS
jgi:HEAT repeat protein